MHALNSIKILSTHALNSIKIISMHALKSVKILSTHALKTQAILDFLKKTNITIKNENPRCNKCKNYKLEVCNHACAKI